MSHATDPKQAGRIELTDVVKRFHGNEVLHGISMTVERGEVVAVIGPSGSGKSTLLRCVNALEPVDGGSVKVNGSEIGRRLALDHDYFVELSPGELARQRISIGMVFQQFNLFPNLTVLENVTLALHTVLKMNKPEADRIAYERLAEVSMDGFAKRYPRTLSGGQQQRVAIARALAASPSVMLFDEPTSALDPELVGEVIEVLRQLASQEITMLIATHEMAFARDACTRTVFMEDGAVVEDGPSERVFRAPSSPRTAKFLERILNR
ncbi:amino acid ABC transporter ATP-binding protein [Streptomyces sp. KS_5]|uniref:amino acid ABC transporter ATP-binding protein n=1 Tax=Streptomyces sp. KS_5 TaxID=1881018 RepID=UPI000895F220|nr:amino acid ABC transporter ATP-binding protein [Streptomyces sp. KS_5]SEE34020.1 polar amino acid transport system ATP-binding protein [Streptomyces sp. KS_5]